MEIQNLINYHQAGRWLILTGSAVYVLLGAVGGYAFGKGLTSMGSLFTKLIGKGGEENLRVSSNGIGFEIKKSHLTTLIIFLFMLLGCIFVYLVIRDVATTEFPYKIG